MKTIAVLFALSSVLSACSSPDRETPKNKASAPWQTQLDALDKAKQVEGQMLDQDRKRREQLEKMTR
ncbi:MAG: hypothetical protein DSZ33_04010 [Gammaproteobacteria bacterium]|nr:MAG: hypothetical protein DSZ33_04010 [Gammaproteobacteria bacterium]